MVVVSLWCVVLVSFIIRVATQEVYICTNRDPSLNDVTTSDLKQILNSSSVCSVLKESYLNGNLQILEVAKSSCCLDLCFLDADIIEVCKFVDLLVIEGMGRAVHTNLEADFNVDCLRVAVIKDHWFSKKLGGSDFSCVFKFTKRN